MYLMILALICLASFTSAVPMAKYFNTTTPCASLHVIVVRGTCESQTKNNGEGVFYKVANMITAQVHGSDSTGLVYPASGALTCLTPTYVESVRAGNELLTAAIQSYSAVCPRTKFALIGYSQGGQVVGDVVCGMSEWNYGPPIPSMASPYLSKVVAAVIFGDPAYVAHQPYDRGTDTTSNGVAPRRGTAACTGFASRIRSYCNANDKWCASGNSTAVHGAYVATNGIAAAKFVVSRYHHPSLLP